MPMKPGLKSNFSRSSLIPGFLQKAIALHQGGNLQQAARRYQQIIDLSPDHFDATHLLAVVNAQVGQHERARVLFDRALALQPGHAEAHFNKGTMEKAEGKLLAAVGDFSLALKTAPDHLGALNNRSLALQDMQRLEEALLDSDRLIDLMPNDPTFQNNRGRLLHEMMRLNEALACFDEAVRLKPDYVEALNNRGNLLTDLHRLDEAFTDYDSAIAINPDFPNAHFNKSIALLLNGDLATGWPLWEWRWRQPKLTSPIRDFEETLWIGDTDIAGKTILLHSEQGLGDTVQFIRYVPMVDSLGARVVVEAPAILHPLLRKVSGIGSLVDKGDKLPPFDLHCPLMSLPRAFLTTIDTIPAPDAYLTPSPDRVAFWSSQIGETAKPRVALAWRGNPNNSNDHNRSAQLAEIQQFLAPDIDWLCLHNDLDGAERNLAGTIDHLRVLGDTDLEDVAAICALSDLVVSVDTSFAHIAGAMGLPTFVMLPFSPDWRWMLDRVDSPWYPTMTLFRQDETRDWGQVMGNVLEALKKAA